MHPSRDYFFPLLRCEYMWLQGIQLEIGVEITLMTLSYKQLTPNIRYTSSVLPVSSALSASFKCFRDHLNK